MAMAYRAPARNVPLRHSTGEKPIRAYVCPRCRTKSRVNVNALATLKQLGESPVSITPPDINASLAAVRSARAAREKR